MAIVKLNPAGSMMKDRFFPNAFSSLFDQMVNDYQSLQKSNFFTPGTDISESEKGYDLELVLPGMKKEDIKIDLNGDVITISGERKFEKEDKSRSFLRIESNYGSFSRSFNLPEAVKKEEVNARFSDGILHVHLPKAEKSLPKKIEIA